MILLIQHTWSTQIHTDRKEQSGCQGLGRKGEMSHSCLMGRVSVLQNEKAALYLTTNLNILNTTELYTLRQKLLCSFFFLTQF